MANYTANTTPKPHGNGSLGKRPRDQADDGSAARGKDPKHARALEAARHFMPIKAKGQSFFKPKGFGAAKGPGKPSIGLSSNGQKDDQAKAKQNGDPTDEGNADKLDSEPRAKKPKRDEPLTRTEDRKLRLRNSTRKRQQPLEDDEDLFIENKDEIKAQMQKMMGFTSFSSTKETKVPGNWAVGGVSKESKSQFRQYMNRKGGFNRPLSPEPKGESSQKLEEQDETNTATKDVDAKKPYSR